MRGSVYGVTLYLDDIDLSKQKLDYDDIETAITREIPGVERYQELIEDKEYDINSWLCNEYYNFKYEGNCIISVEKDDIEKRLKADFKEFKRLSKKINFTEFLEYSNEKYAIKHLIGNREYGEIYFIDEIMVVYSPREWMFHLLKYAEEKQIDKVYFKVTRSFEYRW